MATDEYTAFIEMLEGAPQQGWQCPKCKTIWSPYVKMCHQCFQPVTAVQKTPVQTTTSSTLPDGWQWHNDIVDEETASIFRDSTTFPGMV